MRGALIAVAVVVALALSALPANAAEPIVLDLVIDQPRTVTVGDHVKYTVVLEVDDGTDIALAPSALPPEVALVNQPAITRTPIGPGREEVQISFELAPFVVGDLELPPLPVRYSLPDGTSGVVETTGSIITISSVLPPNAQPVPRDLKPQAEIGTPPATWPTPVIAGLVAAFVLLLFAALVRRRIIKYRETRRLYRAPALSGPEDITRGILNKAGQQFSADHDYTRYYTTIGNAVRTYLTLRYGFPAFALTTRELEAAMMDLGLDRWQVRVASGLLAQCDAVVYAQYRPAAERADADLTAAFEIVEMSRPEERALPETEAEEAPVA